jgi:hypothetical protein
MHTPPGDYIIHIKVSQQRDQDNIAVKCPETACNERLNSVEHPSRYPHLQTLFASSFPVVSFLHPIYQLGHVRFQLGHVRFHSGGPRLQFGPLQAASGALCHSQGELKEVVRRGRWMV